MFPSQDIVLVNADFADLKITKYFWKFGCKEDYKYIVVL